MFTFTAFFCSLHTFYWYNACIYVLVRNTFKIKLSGVVAAYNSSHSEDCKFKASLDNLVKPCLKKIFNPKSSLWYFFLLSNSVHKNKVDNIHILIISHVWSQDFIY
jgi:hypothetical protein